jgi:trimeric autotransporter adhesin
MTSNNQVSPVIRISRGERDASARATHLKAASKKYLETTIERKQMSTTTNFKRIALVAVAALGLGVLSSVPSQAAINADTLTLSATTATQTTAETYTATSAVVTVSFFGAIRVVDTSGATVDSNVATVSPVGTGRLANSASVIWQGTNTAAATVKYAVYLATTNASDGGIGGMRIAPATAGTYVVKLTPAAIGVGPLVGATAQTLTITVTEAATLSSVVSAATSTFVMTRGEASGSIDPALHTVDSVVVVSKTTQATSNDVAAIKIVAKNAAGGAAGESITVAITGSGQIALSATNNIGTAQGRSLNAVNGDYVGIYPDGTEGVGTITFTGSVSGTLLATKKVTFYGPVKSFVATSAGSIIAPSGSATPLAVSFVAKDAALNTLANEETGDTWYAFSSDPTIATVSADVLGASAYAVDSGVVSVTGVKAGSVTITIGNKSTLALSTIKSNAVTVRVGSTAIASVTLAFDKTTYAPGEKAVVTLTSLDATNLPNVPASNLTLWGTGLSVDKAFLQGKVDTEVAVTFAAASSATTGAVAGSVKYTVYMPSTPGKVTITGTLAKTSPLAAAIQGTDVTASATVVDSGSAALAAVTALATTVASLRTLIVTLTNLVLKIQKKVKA